MEKNTLTGFFLELYEALLGSLERCEGGPFAAGVVQGGTLIARGTNSVLVDRDVSRHAEINALAAAGGGLGAARESDTVLLSTHFPCLMCYHAVKWARIGRVYYLFDYAETERLFGFRGDRLMLEELGVPFEALASSPSLKACRLRSPELERLYRDELVRLWNEKYRATCGEYDIRGP
jgi:tRNA(Arg) A34 adenosine deaminase TadA